MKTADLIAELGAASASVTNADRHELADLGIPPHFLVIHWEMIGLVRVSIRGGFYEPDLLGSWAYITPLCVGSITFRDGALIDLLCWDVQRPDRWARRMCSGEYLGLPFDGPDTAIRRTPLNWFRSGGHGLVLLTTDPIRRYEILAHECAELIAEDETHREEIRRMLIPPYPVRPIYIPEAA